MVSYTEGTEVSVSDPTEWSALAPVPGWVIEVYMEESSHPTLSQTWAAFYMVGVDTETDGSHLLSVKFLGAEDEALSQTLAGQFFRGGRIHLCLSRPCVEVRPMDALHVTRIKFWSWDTFKDSADYLIAGIGRSVTRWRKEIEAKPLEDPRGTAAPKKTPGKPKEAKDKGRAKPDTTAVGSGLSQEMKDRLKGKLSDIKKRVRGTAGAVHSSPPAERDGIPVDESEEDEVDYVPTSPEGDAAITTGTALVPHGKVLDKTEHRKAKRTRKDVDTKDIGSKSLSTQLIMRAVEATKLRKKQAKRKKSKKGKETRVVRLLSKILTGKSSGKEKAEKRSKRRRTMKDGVIRSCSSSSSDGETGTSLSQESEEDLEAPMKKRSRDRPGSVLAMLTEHIRTVMEQSATADIPQDDVGVTTGIKVASYFLMHIKPHYHQYQRELREMHSLSATLDLLRLGDVARVGDSLSARFMALHQSMIDQSWSTARHMELHNMDETSAASAGMILASRKHSRLVDKVHGKGWNSSYWGGKGKGRGKTDWKGQQEDYKGEKGKGKKGKKGHYGKWQNSGNWDKKVNDWEKNKEKQDEKA